VVLTFEILIRKNYKARLQEIACIIIKTPS